MNQEIIMEDSVCENNRFYKCVVKNSFCKNCGKSYVKKGDVLEGRCDDCEKKTKIIVDMTFTDGTFRGDCQECLENSNAISKLYEDFVWARDTEGSYEEIIKREEKALNKVVKLPPSQLKTFLRHMNSSIER